MSVSAWDGSDGGHRRLTDVYIVIWAHGGGSEDMGGMDGL